MPETPPIPPALSAQEWERVRLGQEHRGYFVPHDILAPRDAASEEHAKMALANFALPDGDPRKVTREDVAAVLDAWEHSSGNEDDDSTLRRLAMKLAAILPPEGEPDAE